MRRVTRRPEAIWDVVDGTLTICNTANGEFFELNDTGQFIWEVCESRTVEAIAAALKERYPSVSEPELNAHLSQYLTGLADAGLMDLGESEVAAEVH